MVKIGININSMGVPKLGGDGIPKVFIYIIAFSPELYLFEGRFIKGM
jgi:hypothetical protein